MNADNIFGCSTFIFTLEHYWSNHELCKFVGDRSSLPIDEFTKLLCRCNESVALRILESVDIKNKVKGADLCSLLCEIVPHESALKLSQYILSQATINESEDFHDWMCGALRKNNDVVQLIASSKVHWKTNQKNILSYGFSYDCSFDVIRMLLSQNYDNPCSVSKCIAMLAAHKLNEEVFRYLLAKLPATDRQLLMTDYNIVDYFFRCVSVADPSIWHIYEALFSNMYDIRNEKRENLLFCTTMVSSSYSYIVTKYCDRLSITNKNGCTALNSKNITTSNAILLIESGADINTQDNEGKCPLMKYPIHINREILKRYMDKIDCTLVDKKNNNLLHNIPVEFVKKFQNFQSMLMMPNTQGTLPVAALMQQRKGCKILETIIPNF